MPIVKRWTSPTNGNGIFWYSFDYGVVHVIQMSSEHDWTQGSAQYEWMVSDLSSLNRSVTPFVILTAHRMMYTTQMPKGADYLVSTHMQQELQGLLLQYRVNLMMTGHQHSYERTCPLQNSACAPSGVGTVHVVVGSAGADLENGGFSTQVPALCTERRCLSCSTNGHAVHFTYHTLDPVIEAYLAQSAIYPACLFSSRLSVHVFCCSSVTGT